MTNAMRNDVLIEEVDVEVRPEHVPMKCLDENVCIATIRMYASLQLGSILPMMLGSWLRM